MQGQTFQSSHLTIQSTIDQSIKATNLLLRLHRVDLKLVQGRLNALFCTFPFFLLGITLASKALTPHTSWKGGID